MKRVIGFLSLLWLLPAFAAREELSFHGGCEKASAECVEFHYPGGGRPAVLAKKRADMVVSKEDIATVFKIKNEFEQEGLSIRLKAAGAKKFEQVTKENMDRILAIVANGKVLTAPVVQSPISGGAMVITNGSGKSENYLAEVLWLKKMAEQK